MATPPRSPINPTLDTTPKQHNYSSSTVATSQQQMRPASPTSNLILPPPLARPTSSHSLTGGHHQARGDMTLPPLSTVSPLARPITVNAETAAFSLSNLIHQPDPRPRPPSSSGEPSWKTRDRREVSPGPSRRPYEAVEEDPQARRVVRGRQSLPDQEVRYPHEAKGYFDHDQSRSSSSRGYDQSAPPPQQYRAYEPRRTIVHPSTITEHPRRLTEPTNHRPPVPQPQSQHPPQAPGQAHHPGQWTIYPPPHPHAPYQASHNPSGQTHTQGHRRSSSMAEAWFALGDLPPRQQYGWSRDRVEGYAAGWEDALRSVEAGVFGVGGQQYIRPTLVRKDIPPPHTHTVLGPPPLRQSSSSDPGPYIPMGAGPASGPSNRASFEAPIPTHTQGRSISFSHHRRPSTTYPPIQRHSYSSTSMSMSMSPTSPSSTGERERERERERKHRQAISCYPCRGRKLKCDGEKPCSQCVRRGGAGECEYAQAVRRRGKGKKGKSLDGEDDESVSAGSGEGD